MAYRGLKHARDSIDGQKDIIRYVAWYPYYDVGDKHGVELEADADQYAYVKFMIPSDFVRAIELYPIVNPAATLGIDFDIYWQISQIWWGRLLPTIVQPNANTVVNVSALVATQVESGAVIPNYCRLEDFLPELLSTAASAALAKGMGGEIAFYRNGNSAPDNFPGSIHLNRIIMRYIAEQ